MKRVLALLTLLALATALLAGCGSGTPTPTDPANVKGETFDTGSFTVLVPNGWKAFPVSDLFDEYDGDNDPTQVQICKGADNSWDILSKPYIQVYYYDAETTASLQWKELYDEATDIEPITIGERTWTGFDAKSDSYEYTFLTTGEEGADQFNVTVLRKSSDSATIAVADADVQALLASIVVK